MPEIMIGIPKYDHKDCTAYVIDKLRDNGLVVRYTHPNLLFISWKYWIPTYVRSEIKKKTGQHIDEYGNLINKNQEDDNSKFNNTNEDNYNNIILNNKNKSDKSKRDFKDIKSYNPSGNLIYSNNLLKKLDINS